MRQLVGLNKRLSEIEAAGGALLAISVDPPADTRALLERLKDDERPRFPVVSDPGRVAVKRLGVHDRAHDLALPAVLIIDAQGKLAWKYVAANVMDRPDEDGVIAALKALGPRTP